MNNFFYRKQAFLLLEKCGSVEQTKTLFLEKLRNMLNQYSILKQTIIENKHLHNVFSDSAMFIMDLNIKKIEALIFLANSGEAEWNILLSFTEENKSNFIDDSLSTKYSVLNIDKLGDFKKKFFYILKKYHIINSEQFEMIQKINIARDNLSLAHLNDYYLDENKMFNQNMEFDSQELETFRNTPLQLKNFDSSFWNFIQVVLHSYHWYLDYCIYLLRVNKYNYSKIINSIDTLLETNNPANLKTHIPENIWNDKKSFTDFLCEFRKIITDINQNVGRINFYFEQFYLLENSKINPLLNQLFVFFLSASCIDSYSIKSKNRTNNERLLHAEYYLDLINIILRENLFFEKHINKKMLENFINLNKTELSIIANEKVLTNLKTYHFKQYIVFSKKIKQIIYNPNYRKRLDYFLRKYFKDLRVIGLPKFFKLPAQTPTKINNNIFELVKNQDHNQ
ncbi:hypothetical protein J2Z62_000234 [Mycoplasmoides fastidiosum]|uniref:Uncharacterized protein n=1 Tax=Mycoplasmoides fastidiosum TaxID=92758 RepID=A0ABU0LYL8_9BACT|nr:hypothetical protein [Mycoplasmoides fastidiosum]MDQ0513796.1 hypothetical protein [Mycoplasmoides fastidiosum]UUD37786.1 hypothetical protein NPA10_00080 [Mycoplasmoides fastidiosum]